MFAMHRLQKVVEAVEAFDLAQLHQLRGFI
jgi:RecG-like helicase